MIPITENVLIEMHFIKQVYEEVCNFIDSMILYGGKAVTKDDLNWIVNCIGNSVLKDNISAQITLYSALYKKYNIETLYGYSIRQVSIDDFITDEPCVLKDIPPTDEMFLPDNRETRRHGYNYAKETSYKKPNRRRPWE